MAKIMLYPWQLDAVGRIRNGSVVCGGVGSGKSLTALAWYYVKSGGDPGCLQGKAFVKLKGRPKDLYIITTARKRDTMDWEKEMAPFLMNTDPSCHAYANKVIVDSWNNMHKYENVENGVFIFDEQRLVGYGPWVKSFLRISKKNKWILLSATPGDKWIEYAPLFIANGFYKNISEFRREHVIWAHNTNFPQIRGYVNEKKLKALQKEILVDMDFRRPTEAHHEDVFVNYDIQKYKHIMRTRWDPWKDEPIENAAGLCYCLRRCVNSDESRQQALLELAETHPRMIVFYMFDYELDILRGMMWDEDTALAEWNGHKHEPIPATQKWVYLVQYTAGCEGWNCIQTDTIVFWCQNYSYKVMVQASGRTDRVNTPYHDLYYYHLKSRSSIDLAIAKALKEKREFNEKRFVKW